MGWQNLVDYIRQQNASGYDIDTIKNFLLQSGYAASDIETAINYIYQQPQPQPQPQAQPQAQAQSDGLVNYIYQQMSQGYTIEDIKDYLVNYGYDPSNVQSAIDQVSQTKQVNVTHTFHVSKNAMVLVSLFFLFVLVSSYIGYMLFSPTEPIQQELLDVDSLLLNPNQKLYPGNALSFNVELFNFGSNQRYDVKLIHNVIAKVDRRSVRQETETVAVEVRASKVSRIQLPSDMRPGDYELETVAKYSGKVASASFEFTVYEEPDKPVEPIEPVEPVEPIEPVEPVEPIEPIEPIEPVEPVEPVEQNDTYDDMSEAEYFILISGTKDIDKLGGICDETTDSDLVKLCFTMLAVKSSEQENCLRLEERNDIDFCYRTYALSNEEIDTCGQVENKASRDLCKMLINTANIFNTRDVSYDLDPWDAKINFDMDEAMENLDMQYLSGSDLSIFFSMFMVE